jgi:3-deoxy-D-manno-octulosonic-acid transferase
MEAMIAFFYQIFSFLIYPIITPILKKRIKKGKEEPQRYREKLGFPTQKKPKGKLIYVNAASVGEVNAVIPLLKILRDKGLNVLLTSASLSSYETCKSRFPQGVIHQFLPVDSLICTRRFINHWKPDYVVFVESELLYNLLKFSKKYAKKLILINARFSAKSMKKWVYFKSFLRSILSLFDEIVTYDKTMQNFLDSVSIKSAIIPNIKYDCVGDLVVKNSEIARVKPVIVIVSTHQTEEETILNQLYKLKDRVQIILIPRHPKRTPEICEIIQKIGLSYTLNSQTDNPQTDGIYLVDSLGKAMEFIEIADIVIMGGTFNPKVGGHNILEPASLAKPIISGHFYANFLDTTNQMQKEEAIIITDDLYEAVERLVNEPDLRVKIGQNAHNHLKKNQGTTQFIAEKIIKFINENT